MHTLSLDDEFSIQIFHDYTEEDFQKRVISTLGHYSDKDTEVYVIVEPKAHRIVSFSSHIEKSQC